MRRPGRLVRKYLVIMVALVTGVLLASGAVEIYASYYENKAALGALQREKAGGAASQIESFVREIERQLGWTTQPLLVPPAAAIEQRRLDAVRLQKQVLAITEVSHLDAAGREQLRVSRLAMDVIGGHADFSRDPKFTVAKSGRTYFGPVYFRKESEPYMTIAMPQSGGGVTVAEVNLKFIWDVVSQIKVGKAGLAYVVDGQGALIAHPDISLVLQKTNLAGLAQVKAALTPTPGDDVATIGKDPRGRDVLAAHSAIAPLGWVVLVEQPLDEAFAPLRASAYRTMVLVALGIGLSAVASAVLARRLAKPIQALQVSAAKIGAGELDHQIAIRTGDELESLADEFNRMTGRLRESYANLEQKVEDRTRALTESLEQQTATAEILRVISASPTDVQPVLEAVAESAARLCGASDALIQRVEGDVMRLVAHLGSVPIVPTMVVRPVTPGTPAGRAVVERRTIHVHDIVDDLARGDFAEARPLHEGTGFRTVLVTPLMRDDVAIGTIIIRRLEVRPFTDAQIALLQTFADQAVIAIENVRLFKELEARNAALTESLEQQTATAEILRVISASPTDVQPVLEAVAESAARLCGAADALIQRVEGDVMRRVAHVGSIPTVSMTTRPVTPGTPAGRGIVERRTIHVHDIVDDIARGDYAEARALQEPTGFRTILVTPLMRDDVAIGVIVIRRLEVRPFTDAQIALLQTFADQAVIAIENVRLFKELEARNADLIDALDQQTATGEVLRVISSSPTDIQPVFQALLESAARLCEASNCDLLLRIDGDRLQFAATYGQGMQPGRMALSITPGLVSGRAVLEGRTIHVHDMPALRDEFPASAAIQAEWGHRTVLAVPLLRERTALGVIFIRRLEVRPFSDKQVRLLETFAAQAVIAIENVRLFKELEEKNRVVTAALEQQTATAEVLRVISSSPTEVRPVFETIIDSAIRLMHAKFGGVYRVDGTMIDLAIARGWGPEVRELNRRHFPMPPGGGSLIARAIRDKRVVQVADSEADPALPQMFVDSQRLLGTRSCIAVPMFREGVPVGGIVVAREEAALFPDEQVALLQTFADQAVIAIENVRLFKELEERNRTITEALGQQTATAEILRVISSSPTDVQPVLDAVAENATRVCEAGDGSVLLIRDGAFRVAAHYGTISMPYDEAIPIVRGTVAGRAVLESSPVHVPDLLAAGDFPEGQLLGARFGNRTTLATPLLREGTPIGALLIRRTEVRPFTDQQIALLQTFADQAVIAIENVRLFQELQARTADLTRSVGELEALGEVSRAISSTLDLEVVLATIVSRANELAETDGCAIFEFDEATRAFRLRATERYPDEFMAALRATSLVYGEGAIGRAAATREPVQVPDVADTDVYSSPVRDALMRAGYRSLLAVPLVSEDEVVGALVVNRRVAGAFADRTVEMLRTFATQSALAIQNARLFSEIETKSHELEIANRHKDEFLASMSHELRTPLNAIIGFSEVMLERLFGDVNAKQEEYLHDILSSGRHLLSLINDIDLAKIEAGRMELEPADFDLPQAIDNALVLVRERAMRRGITLEQSIDPRLGEIKGDERKIKQVMLNLLSNAVKFTPEGGRIDVRAVRADGVAEISVADTGVGIAPADHAAVFEEFRQVGTDYARKHEGTGLGLALARKFVELHGGTIRVDSQLGQGATFTFTIPVTPWQAS